MYQISTIYVSLIIGWLLSNIALVSWVCNKKWPKVRGQIDFDSNQLWGHGGIFRYQHLEDGVMYICTNFQPDITTNLEVFVGLKKS